MLRSMRFIVAVLVSTFIYSAADAATVGYWRFEDSPGFLNDSSGNGNTLTNLGTTQYTLPGSGDGSDFSNPIPLTSESNAKAGDFDGTVPNRVSRIFGSNPIANDFTIEAYINLTNRASTYASIAGQWQSTGNMRSWYFETESEGSNGNELSLFVNENGSSGGSQTIYSGVNIDLNKDYYVAASYNESGGEVTFHIQNLTDGGPLQTITQAHTISSLFLDDDFAIGTLNPSSNSFPWDGIIDEVRFSTGVLGVNELLITAPVIVPIPEPGSCTLLMLGLVAFAARRRRSRA